MFNRIMRLLGIDLKFHQVFIVLSLCTVAFFRTSRKLSSGRQTPIRTESTIPGNFLNICTMLGLITRNDSLSELLIVCSNSSFVSLLRNEYTGIKSPLIQKRGDRTDHLYILIGLRSDLFIQSFRKFLANFLLEEQDLHSQRYDREQ